ncbi:MAG TPA: orotidine-5'-phosphate decarboxylase [Rhodospirillaceae bacterium]|nr:orotidine-5'-phosphate decarboxylase [Rhodospirillaceae bacterium]
MTNKNPVFCALDTPDSALALDLASKLKGHVGGLKIGLEYFMANGSKNFSDFSKLGMPIFLDVKLHDIPNTVAGAISSLLSLEPDFITIHTSGGAAMMEAAAKAAAEAPRKKPKLLGVTVLTSLDSDDLGQLGQDVITVRQVKRLALLAQESGLDGVICSPAEVKMLRDVCGPDFILMVPGIRPSWAASGDQKRVMTPREAVDQGATHLVIGRPITGADDPVAAADLIADEFPA